MSVIIFIIIAIIIVIVIMIIITIVIIIVNIFIIIIIIVIVVIIILIITIIIIRSIMRCSVPSRSFHSKSFKWVFISFFQVHRVYTHDLRVLFDVEPHEVFVRVCNSFLPGWHSSVLQKPDLYGPMVAVLTMPQVREDNNVQEGGGIDGNGRWEGERRRRVEKRWKK